MSIKCERCGRTYRECIIIPDELVVFRCACRCTAVTKEKVLFAKDANEDTYFVVEIGDIEHVSKPFKVEGLEEGTPDDFGDGPWADGWEERSKGKGEITVFTDEEDK